MSEYLSNRFLVFLTHFQSFVFLVGGVSAYTSQAVGNVMATGSVAQSVNYGQTIQIGQDRYVIANPASRSQYDRVYATGMSG